MERESRKAKAIGGGFNCTLSSQFAATTRSLPPPPPAHPPPSTPPRCTRCCRGAAAARSSESDARAESLFRFEALCVGGTRVGAVGLVGRALMKSEPNFGRLIQERSGFQGEKALTGFFSKSFPLNFQCTLSTHTSMETQPGKAFIVVAPLPPSFPPQKIDPSATPPSTCRRLLEQLAALQRVTLPVV